MNIYKGQQWLLVLAASALFVAWLLPNHYSPWATAYQEFAAFFSGLLLITAMLLAGPVKVSPALLVFFLLPVIPLLQLGFGLIYFAGDAWITSLYLLGFALMLQVGYHLAARPVSRDFFVRLLAGLFILAAVLSVWIALRQWLLLPGSIWTADLPPGARPFANMGQPNNLATLLCMGLAGVLYVYEKHLLGSVAAGLLACFLLVGVALTQSRAPWPTAIAVVAFWAVKANVYTQRLTLRGLLGWLGVYACCFLVLTQLAEWLLLSDVDVGRSGSVSERWSIWSQLWQDVWRGPWWGYGWNQVAVAQMQGALHFPAPSISLDGHNLLLDLMVWNGPLLGGLIFFGVVVWLAGVGARVRSAESLFALLAAGFILGHSMVEFPFESAFFLFPLGLLLGVAAAEGPQFAVVMPRWLMGVVLVMCVGLFGWFWREYRIVEEDHRLLRLELARVGTIKAAQPAPDVILLSQLREFIRFARTPPTSGISAFDLDRMGKVVYRYPSISGLLRYVVALGLNGQPAAAREQLMLFRHLYGYGQRRHGYAMFELQEMQKQYPKLFEQVGDET
ncbi:Wzy polymerase domain-containing protein [Pseudomonas sp. LS44]|uniref:PglL family O-oligosaccharyltransferase n=1 Tax=Pseudomonas sp. LS44 TaxID=1357074 RepID=UPI00215B2417|nr:O-antigen ligase family protein [Pseudomonas sp. LS44]UVE18519.1 Wzy polymerase domain-containing protein [Pseudomonas sp. LS44]